MRQKHLRWIAQKIKEAYQLCTRNPNIHILIKILKKSQEFKTEANQIQLAAGGPQQPIFLKYRNINNRQLSTLKERFFQGEFTFQYYADHATCLLHKDIRQKCEVYYVYCTYKLLKDAIYFQRTYIIKIMSFMNCSLVRILFIHDFVFA